MPSLKVADTIFSPNPTFWSSTRLNNFRAWRTVKIDGHPETAVTTTGNRIGQALMTMQVGTLHENGLRIRFGPHATYTHLILVITAMDQYNQKNTGWISRMDRRHFTPSLRSPQERSRTFYRLAARRITTLLKAQAHGIVRHHV